jgi:hypothetical protein
MSTPPIVAVPLPPPAAYLGSGVYAEPYGNLVKIWTTNAMAQQNTPIFLDPELLGQLLIYANRCWVPVTAANEDADDVTQH